MRISDWSSDVCSSDLFFVEQAAFNTRLDKDGEVFAVAGMHFGLGGFFAQDFLADGMQQQTGSDLAVRRVGLDHGAGRQDGGLEDFVDGNAVVEVLDGFFRSEEHTSELQSLMRISYAVFCLKKKNKRENNQE